MITCKLTTKARTTISRPIRAALHLKEGDTIAYVISGEKVILYRAPTQPVDDPFANFEEWSSEADRRAYADL